MTNSEEMSVERQRVLVGKALAVLEDVLREPDPDFKHEIQKAIDYLKGDWRKYSGIKVKATRVD